MEKEIKIGDYYGVDTQTQTSKLIMIIYQGYPYITFKSF